MCDCDLPSAKSEHFPVARKPHECCECFSVIPPGAKYQKFSGVWDGHGMTFKTCMACHAVREEYMMQLAPGDCGPCFGSLWEDATDNGNISRDVWLVAVGYGATPTPPAGAEGV